MTSSPAPIGWVKVPPVAAIGWIPFYLRVDDVPANDYTRSRPKVYDYLFDSGNRDPVDYLNDEEGFLRVIASNDYRGAFFLNGLNLYRSTFGFTHHNSDFRRMEYVGYTPIRHVQRGSDPPAKHTDWESRGLGGSNGLSIEVEAHRVVITQRVEFRICKYLQVVGGLLTFNLRSAPYAWMEMEFTIYSHGHYEIEFRGSSIPSQQLYVDWKRSATCRYDMLSATHQEMEGFLGAGDILGFRKPVRAPARRGARLYETGQLW